PPNYPLTDRLQFDILRSGPGWRGPDAIRSIETARVHHAARRRGRAVAARGARGAARADAAGRRADGLSGSPVGVRIVYGSCVNWAGWTVAICGSTLVGGYPLIRTRCIDSRGNSSRYSPT